MKITPEINMAGLSLCATDEAVPSDRAIIAAGLASYNEARGGTPDVRPLNILLKDERAITVGGLWGRTYWRWLYVELLFVPDELRGHDFGARLLGAAESEARTRECVGAWLDTFAFQAPGFYERQGYQRFGELPGYPPGFSRMFFAKQL